MTFFKFKAVLLLVGLSCLCCVFFVLGRYSVDLGKPNAHATHEMNELDRLQQETATQR